MLLVNDFLEQSAKRTPEKEALICDGQRLSYAQIDAMANRLANALRDRGVGRGDRVVLFLPNTVESVVGIFAVLKTGGVFVVVNNTTKADKLAHLINNCRATALVAPARQIEAVTRTMRRAPSLKFAVLAGKISPEAMQNRPELISFDTIQADYPASQPQRQYIDQAFEKAHGNESLAARLLGLNHHTYRYRRRKLHSGR